jgi:hypothetical protein
MDDAMCAVLRVTASAKHHGRDTTPTECFKSKAFSRCHVFDAKTQPP